RQTGYRDCVGNFSGKPYEQITKFGSLGNDCLRRYTHVAHPDDGFGKHQVKVLESLLEPLDLTLNALALPPVVFCRISFIRAHMPRLRGTHHGLARSSNWRAL